MSDTTISIIVASAILTMVGIVIVKIYRERNRHSVRIIEMDDLMRRADSGHEQEEKFLADHILRIGLAAKEQLQFEGTFKEETKGNKTFKTWTNNFNKVTVMDRSDGDGTISLYDKNNEPFGLILMKDNAGKPYAMTVIPDVPRPRYHVDCIIDFKLRYGV